MAPKTRSQTKKEKADLEEEIALLPIRMGYEFFGRTPLDPPVDPNSIEERLRSLSYWVCCSACAEMKAPESGPNYRGNLDWCLMHVKNRIEVGLAYQDEHPEQLVHPINLSTPDDKTPLHRAVEEGANETLQVLLTHRAERTQPNTNVKSNGLTPLGLLLRTDLDSAKRLACFWTLVNHMLAHNVCDASCPIPLSEFRKMKADGDKFASFRKMAARQNAKRQASAASSSSSEALFKVLEALAINDD